MDGNETKMDGNERKMDGNETKMNGNEKKMKKCQWKGHEKDMKPKNEWMNCLDLKWVELTCSRLKGCEMKYTKWD